MSKTPQIQEHYQRGEQLLEESEQYGPNAATLASQATAHFEAARTIIAMKAAGIEHGLVTRTRW